ncbi:MAG TPA: DEAD/DEAH box helicase [Candidatus Limnocylindrales bacterium]|nr:DEAD/DEAH box helicase [Candidatus Limnocylindrales bacterium]
MSLSAGLQQKLAAAHFTTPTPVQEMAIPHALEGKDVLATAQTGTGKTLAFLLPIMEKLGAKHLPGVRALILVPTRELAIQVQAVYDKLRFGKLPKTALVIGGMAERPQIEAVRKGAGVIVATPGRLEDYLKRRLVDLSKVETLVLDESDRMLDMGFLPALRRIVGSLPKQRQTLFFSATLEASVAGLVNDYMRNPVRVALGSISKPVESVELHAFEVPAADKSDTLRRLLYDEQGQTLIFARTKRGTERLAKNLIRDGFSAAMIHGDRTQSQRVNALNGFGAGTYKVLVATDVASRGIHVDNVAHVINYDLPDLAEDFIHRVGRTGRAGLKGRASTLVSGAEIGELRAIERTLKLKIARKRVDGSEIAAMKPRIVKNTLDSRTLAQLPGEVFC